MSPTKSIFSKGGRPAIPYTQNKITQKHAKIASLRKQLSQFCLKEELNMYELLGDIGEWHYNRNDHIRARMFGKIAKGETPFVDVVPPDRYFF